MNILVNLLLFIISLFGIGEDDIQKQETIQPTSTWASVVRVVDGDTIVVQVDEIEYKVRYIGIDTPELHQNGEPACFSLEASLKNRELVQGKMVRLESDKEDKDRYDRLLRYVYVDDFFVNAELVKEGYAKTLMIKPNTTHFRQFASLERIAAEQNTGLWGACQ